MPIVMPGRFTTELIHLLEKYHKVFTKVQMAIHVNHPDELYEEVVELLKCLEQSFIPLLSQTVLLKGVNDDTNVLSNLFESIGDLGVQPYYLHHTDQVQGASHFYVSLEKGRNLYLKLKDRLSGWAIPQYVLDIPEGAGKIWAFNPESVHFSGKLLGKDGTFHEIDRLKNNV